MSPDKPLYRIEYDPARKILKLVLTGLWDKSTLDAYARDLHATTSKLYVGGTIPADIGSIVDLREHAIQPRDIAQAWQKLIESTGLSRNPCAIILSSSAIQKAQSGRVSAKFSDLTLFTDEAEALAWMAARRST